MDAGRALASLAIAAGAFALLIAFLWATQRSLLYFPGRAAPPPASAALPGAEDLALTTADGLRLGAWFVPARGDGQIGVLVLNGNAGDRRHRAPLAAALAREGFAVLLFDWRGYGGNPGSPTEAGLLMDARGGADALAARVERVAYLGESLGAAVAVALAAERPPLALVLRSPFTSVADMGRRHYPWLPVHTLLLKDRYDALAAIGAVRSPVLVVAGDRDAIVVPSLSRRLYEAASEPKRFVLVEGADHNDAALLDGAPFIGEVTRFLREAAP